MILDEVYRESMSMVLMVLEVSYWTCNYYNTTIENRTTRNSLYN
jgi:hypothetical protein